MPSKKRRRRHRKKASALQIALIILFSILFVIAVAGLSVWYLWNRADKLNEETMFQPQQREDIGEPTPAPTVTPEPQPQAPEDYDLLYEGVYYRLRKNVASVLFMGVDSKTNEEAKDSIAVGTNQADTLLVGIFDTESGQVRILHIPRDTQADVKILDMAGRYVETEHTHICRQHAYGDGGKRSCEMTLDAVDNLLFGAPIYRYVSMGTNGIIKAVDAIGGVELEMLEDFSSYSGRMKKGATVKLNGRNALTYIQGRNGRGLDGTDASRANRQIQFMKEFVNKAKSLAADNPAIALSLYNAVKPYVQTDLSMEELLFLANQALEVGFTEDTLIRLPGVVGEEEQPFFHMDEAAARAIVLELFYEEIPLA